MFQIKNRRTDRAIFTSRKAKTIDEAVLDCIRQARARSIRIDLADAGLTGIKLTDSIDLSGANLRGANLRGANLTNAYMDDVDLTNAILTEAILIRADLSNSCLFGADLTDANLTNADLSGADLTMADFVRADLSDADMQYACLTDADLTDADLTNADLRSTELDNATFERTDLTCTKLTGADLTGANLTNANLTQAKRDLQDKLARFPNEIPAFRLALVEGRIDGSVYQGPCSCFVGTISNLLDCHYESIPDLVADQDSPVERLFLGIKKGDTPENSQLADIVLSWIDELLAKISTEART